MEAAQIRRAERRARQRSTTRSEILTAARRVAERDGARTLSLRGVAAESGFAPAALYVYFRSKDELLVALAADEIATAIRSVREARRAARNNCIAAIASTVLDWLTRSETLAAVCGALSETGQGSESERLFNGRFIALLSELSATIGEPAGTRESQMNVVLFAATLSGLAVLMRTGRLDGLGFPAEELLQNFVKRFETERLSV